MPDLKSKFNEHKMLISDGAWGTELAKLGMEPGCAPEKMNLEQPGMVGSVADSYIEADADIILTNTFGGSSIKLAKIGLADQVFEINRIGAKLSVEAAGERAIVFGSVGPTGEFMSPLGTITQDEMIAAFAEQIKGLLAGGVNGIVIETMTDLGEACSALRAARENTDLPVVVSMTYDKGPAGFATMMGVKPEQAAAELEKAGADFIGSNCGQGIENMIEIARIMHSNTQLPLWVKSNAGLPQLVDGQTVFLESPQFMAKHISALFDAGVKIMGGCCGTTPEHIRHFVAERNRIDASVKSSLTPRF